MKENHTFFSVAADYFYPSLHIRIMMLPWFFYICETIDNNDVGIRLLACEIERTIERVLK